jgi:hypothetical protein
MKRAALKLAFCCLLLVLASAFGGEPNLPANPNPFSDGEALVKQARQQLKNGTPEEKETALELVRALKSLELIPEVIEAIEDPTPLPRHDDTSWGFVGHQAATVLAEIAQRIDGIDRRGSGHDAYSFFTDASEGGEQLKKLGRLAEVRKSWTSWWKERPWNDRVLPQDPNGNFVLYVSNQSFDINPVDVTIYIDGQRAIQSQFDVKGNRTPQHNWIQHTFRLPAGKHVLKAVSKNGDATLESEFEIKDRHWAAIDYWYYPKVTGGSGPVAKSFRFDIRDTPIRFE